MVLRVREHGDGALVHGLRSRPSNHKLPARFEQKVLFRVGLSLQGFNLKSKNTRYRFSLAEGRP